VDVGTEIKRLRETRGLTQLKLADLSDLTRNYIALVEANKKQPSLSSLERIAVSLNVHPSSILGADKRIIEIRERILNKYGGMKNIQSILEEIS